MEDSALRESYEATPYEGWAFPQAHPERMAVIAALNGLEPPPPDKARILELGCAQGNHLIPIAYYAPETECVGVDFVLKHINDALGSIKRLDLQNIQMLHADFLELDDSLGQFDYVIAHGIYSWVPENVRVALLQLFRRYLKPQGLGYISYNCMPGWALHGGLRRMMRLEVKDIEKPADRIACVRNIAAHLHAAVSQRAWGSNKKLTGELNSLMTRSDVGIIHDLLEEYSDPFYFTDIIERLAAADLQFVSEAEVVYTQGHTLGKMEQTLLEQMKVDRIKAEGYRDLMESPMLRQSVVCQSAQTVQTAPVLSAIDRFWVRANLARDALFVPGLKQFQDNGRMHLPSVSSAALGILNEITYATPQMLNCEELMQRHGEAQGVSLDELRTCLWEMYRYGLVDFRMSPPKVGVDPGSHPKLDALASLWHFKQYPVINPYLRDAKLSKDLSQNLHQFNGKRPLADFSTAWIDQLSNNGLFAMGE